MAWWTDWRELKALPWPGDMLEQPGFVVDAIQACERAYQKLQAQRDREERERIEKSITRR